MSILYFFKSTADFTVRTDKPTRLIDGLRTAIPLRGVATAENETVKFTCFYKDAAIAKRITAELGGETVSVRYSGIKHLFYKYRRRTGLLAAGICLIFAIMLSELFVWEIRVEGNEKISEGKIVKILNEVGFKEGVLKKSIRLDSIVNEFLIREKDISWIAINYDGTVAHVEVREGKNPKISEKKQNVNLVASNDGVIMRSDVLEGGCLVKAGDVVYKGQILVSAFVDRNEKSTLRGARGSVWANTDRKIMVKIPLNYEKKVYTENSKKICTLELLGRKFHFGNGKASFEHFSEFKEEIRASLDRKIHLPFKATLRTYREYELEEASLTEDEALKLAEKIALQHLSDRYGSFAIASKSENHTISDGELEYICVFSGVENIASESEFEVS